MIQVKNVTKKYGAFKAVDNISFEVQDGEVVGFLGPNGAGKSTTMNMITGYIDPTDGEIIVNGVDVAKKPRIAKKQKGYMPESVPLYQELTVKEFIRYMAEIKLVKHKEIKEEVNKVLEEVGLKDVENKLIRNLSRGYKQRVGIAGALIGNPDVIILDEPTVGLDPKQITEIRDLIKKLGKSHTVILSSHILPEVSQICDKVIIINKGKIVAIDTPSNLEDKTKSKNTILVTVEDPNDNMKNIKNKIKEAEKIKLIKDNKDGTKQYAVISDTQYDLRKKLFDVLPKEQIVIFELKKDESTLEDAFISLINNTNEVSKENVSNKIENDGKKKLKKKKKEDIKEVNNKLNKEENNKENKKSDNKIDKKAEDKTDKKTKQKETNKNNKKEEKK